MPSFPWKSFVLIAVSLVPFSAAAQCQATLDTAKTIATRLQSRYFNLVTGQYENGDLWTDANALEDLHNLMLATDSDDFGYAADQSYIGRIASNPITGGELGWAIVLAGSNDDAGWIVLALWKMSDYKIKKGQNASQFIRSSKVLYNYIAASWDNHCGGGVWWSKENTYKNAITNQLFLLLSAEAYRRFGDQVYLDNAKKTWNWLKQSGMRNADGLWNDGLDYNTCKNNGQTTWIYNQGVIASGLASLYAATKDTSLLTEAEITLDATIDRLTEGKILRESCDDAVRGRAVCNKDQQIFKGIWTKHLQFYLDNANDPKRIEKYKGFLGSQSSAVHHYGTNSNLDVGSVWYAPDQGGSQWTVKSSTSGLAAHVAAAKYGPC